MKVSNITDFIRSVYRTKSDIPLHEPRFEGNEKQYVSETIDTTFVSSVGNFVTRFEQDLSYYIGAKRIVATSSGTTALHTALYIAGIKDGDLVITQALTFVGTCNAIRQVGAQPIFVDTDIDTLGLSPSALEEYLIENATKIGDKTFLKDTKQEIKAVVPMHTFGHPVDLDPILRICLEWNLKCIEDAAESLGSFYKNKHTGNIGNLGVLSFNGNKTITTGGGGAVICPTDEIANRAKHLTTTAKIPHKFEFFHDEFAFNYRLPNLNAALGCAQLENLPALLKRKRKLAEQYEAFFKDTEYRFVKEPHYASSNYWLNAVVCEDKCARDNLLNQTNNSGIMTRPIWVLMSKLPMYSACRRGSLSNSEYNESRLVNLPSSAPDL